MRIVENLNLREYNSYKVNAVCKRAIFFDTEEEIYEYFINNSSQFILLGSGHNVILSKPYYDADLVIFNGNFANISLVGEKLIAESGVFTKDLCEFAYENALTGLEMFYDIPSSIGGAVVMNAGAGGEEIKNLLLKVRYLDLGDNQVKEISKDEINFEYRNSFFQQHTDKIILKVWLMLKEGSKEIIKKKMEEIKISRYAKQPREFPNAGSVFKRPKGYYVGAMIDELQLKGLTIGGAKVSEKHGGFIINYNNATGADIIALIRLIKQKVMDYYGVDLVVEQRII